MSQHALPDQESGPRGSSARQAVALRAGIELFARIGAAVDATGVRLSISAYDHVSSMVLDALVCDHADVSARLAALRAASDALGLPLEVTYDHPGAFGLQVALDIGGVRVRVFDHFTGDDIPPARATLTEDTPTGPSASERGPVDGKEPTPADLAAIVAEEPLIAAELAVVDAEVAVAAGDYGDLAARRLATARRDLAAVATGFTPTGPDTYRPIRTTRRPTAHLPRVGVAS